MNLLKMLILHSVSISVDDMGEFLGWFISSGSCGTFTSEEGDSHVVSINVSSNNKTMKE